jgi:flagellar hook-associated protein 2
MAGTSVDGLVSGLSTSSLITQLMQVEAAPQTALKNRVTAQNKAVTAYQAVNTKLAALTTAAKALSNTDTWGAIKTTSSSDAAAVTAKPGASAGSLSFTVSNLAAAHTVTFKDGSVGALTDPVLTGDSLTVQKSDGSSTTLTLTDTSLQGVVTAINGTSGAAYKAAAVQTSPGRYTLQLTALSTGATTAFGGAPGEIDLLGPTGGTVTTQGQDAKIMVGGTSAYAVTSADNTFTDVLPGVTVTLTRQQAATEPAITVGVAADPDAVAAKVQALVDSANAALNEIAAQTRIKTGTVSAGPLVGDSTMRKLAQDILGSVSGGGGDLGSFSAVGVKLDRDGRLTFDKQTFRDALAADPAKTRAYFDSYTNVAHAGATASFNPGWDDANGLGRKLETVGLIATEGVRLPTDSPGTAKEGLLGGLIKRANEGIRGLNDQVAAWDQRLEVRKAALQRQFSGLETALGKMQQQSSWLAGQIASLPRYS